MARPQIPADSENVRDHCRPRRHGECARNMGSDDGSHRVICNMRGPRISGDLTILQSGLFGARSQSGANLLESHVVEDLPTV